MNHRQILLPPGHSKPIGRYSPGLAVSVSREFRLVFVSGQVATDSRGCVVGLDDPARQTEEVFARIARVLAQAGGRLSDLVSVVIYLKNIDDFAKVSAVRNRLLCDPAPASTLVVVDSLAEPGCIVEISGIAVLPQSPSDEEGRRHDR
ncbi:RidA family protein [Paraburkholderia azotifigens]|uniref:RidA family protein n=1 Tax=Paraburkholderia azotifigens TaxID=2057004 RepID=UPI00317C2C6E